MKKILLFLCLCIMPSILKAECTYSEIKDLNALASHVDYTFEYNEKNKNFNVTLMNIGERLEVRYEEEEIKLTNEEATLSNIEEGTQLRIDVYSSLKNECLSEHLRVIKISIPFVNQFYNSSLCKNHEDLVVCHSKFLDYQISYETFIKLVNKSEEEQKEEKEEIFIEPEKKEESFLDKTVKFLQDYWIKAVIFILTSLVTYSIFSPIYRKIKHRL